ncbi:MAG: YebC/PmpR family DNA-binding transcriptional regulator [Myxococcota bacterium]
MSGHSKWSTIKRKKGAADAKRGKVFTQLIRELTIAARTGGGSPHANPRLRLAIDKARGQNMPKDNIERAIKKGTGELEGDRLEEVRYEGYGPGGVAVIVDTLTDNRNRTVGDIRHLFGKFGGNLGASGCVSYLFEKKGVLIYDAEAIDREALMEGAIEANALDVNEDEQTIEVQTVPEEFETVQQALEKLGFVPQSAEISMVPQTTMKLTGKEAQTMLKLYEALDEHEDVKQVFANFDIADEELMEAAGAR